MTVFSDLLSDVYAVTNRPDLVADTKLAVRTATLKAHRSDFYPKDLFETGLTFSTPALLAVLVKLVLCFFISSRNFTRL